jgi:hypothetical protein
MNFVSFRKISQFGASISCRLQIASIMQLRSNFICSPFVELCLLRLYLPKRRFLHEAALLSSFPSWIPLSRRRLPNICNVAQSSFNLLRALLIHIYPLGLCTIKLRLRFLLHTSVEDAHGRMLLATCDWCCRTYDSLVGPHFA